MLISCCKILNQSIKGDNLLNLSLLMYKALKAFSSLQRRYNVIRNTFRNIEMQWHASIILQTETSNAENINIVFHQ